MAGMGLYKIEHCRVFNLVQTFSCIKLNSQGARKILGFPRIVKRDAFRAQMFWNFEAP
jgi:hypothetical protein